MRNYFFFLCLVLSLNTPAEAHDEDETDIYPTAQQFLDFSKGLAWDFILELPNEVSFKVFVRRCAEGELPDASTVKLLSRSFAGSQMMGEKNYFDITLLASRQDELAFRCAQVAILPTWMFLVLTLEAIY